MEQERKEKVLCNTTLVKIIQFQNSKQFRLSCLWMRHNNSNTKILSDSKLSSNQTKSHNTHSDKQQITD